MPIDYSTHPGYVDNRRLRETFLASQWSPGKLAGAVGITRSAHTTRTLANGEVKRYPYRVGDGTAVRRDLGLAAQQSGGGRGIGGKRRWINARKARQYAEALGLDPADIGL